MLLRNFAHFRIIDAPEDISKTDLYQVTTGNLNLAVKRNLGRFPEDFMFQLTRKEFETLRLQFAISNRGGRRHQDRF